MTNTPEREPLKFEEVYRTKGRFEIGFMADPVPLVYYETRGGRFVITHRDFGRRIATFSSKDTARAFIESARDLDWNTTTWGMLRDLARQARQICAEKLAGGVQ